LIAGKDGQDVAMADAGHDAPAEERDAAMEEGTQGEERADAMGEGVQAAEKEHATQDDASAEEVDHTLQADMHVESAAHACSTDVVVQGRVKRGSPAKASGSPAKASSSPVKRSAKSRRQKLRSDSSSTKLATEDVRSLLRDRTPLCRALPPLAELPLDQDNWLRTDDLDTLMKPRPLLDSNLNPSMRVLLEAMATCKPISHFAFRGDKDGADQGVEQRLEENDEIEDDTVPLPHTSPKRHSGQMLAADEQEEALPDPEILRAASPFEAGVQTPDAAATQALEPDVVPDQEILDPPFEDAMQTTDAAAMETAEPDELADIHMASSLPEPQDESPNDLLVEPWAAPSQPFTQGEDASLNPHTVQTLMRLQDLSQVCFCSASACSIPCAVAPDAVLTSGRGLQGRSTTHKRKRIEHVPMSELTEGAARSEAAKLFYDVLVLQAKGRLCMKQQTEAFEELQLKLIEIDA
jgi:Conserved region of Rad21 / Rec8 like protein